MTLKFIHPTLAQTLRVISYLVAIANLLLTYAATIQSQSWIPPGLAVYYPLIFGLALAVHQTASIFGISPDAKLTQAVMEAAHTNGIVTGAKEMLNQLNKPTDTP